MKRRDPMLRWLRMVGVFGCVATVGCGFVADLKAHRSPWLPVATGFTLGSLGIAIIFCLLGIYGSIREQRWDARRRKAFDEELKRYQ